MSGTKIEVPPRHCEAKPWQSQFERWERIKAVNSEQRKGKGESRKNRRLEGLRFRGLAKLPII